MIRIFGLNKVKAHHINRTLIVMRSGGTSNKSLLNIMFDFNSKFLSLRTILELF